jgi:F-type H+-transporting ATPase subunit b
LLVQLITFLVLTFILNKVLFKPILAIIRERESISEGMKRKAQESKSQLEAGEAAEKSSRSDSLTEGVRLQGVLRAEGQAEEGGILKKAQDEAAEKLAAARRGLAADVEAARGELEKEAAALARDMASKILKRELAA